jgi:hypothetical protein
LFASDTRSSPAAFTASNAVAGARKWYVFGSGVPRVVTAVSRLTIDMSADWNIDDTGPNAVAGFLSNARVRSVKWTSPPNASVISGGVVGVGLGVAAGALDGEGEAGDDGDDGAPEHALARELRRSM